MVSNKQKRIERVYSLSPMQSGMLFHALQNEHSRAYFEQMTFKIKGDIDRDLLQQSFDIIFARYDILRTIFRSDKLEEPLQFVLKQRNFKSYFEDISHLSEAEKNTYLEEFAEKDKEKGFDLTRDILMRASLFKIRVDAYALVWSFHHILMDGWCLGIIYKELIRVYRSLKAGIPPELEAVTPYVNYINWLEQQDKEEGLEYWKNYLEGYEQQAGLPKLQPGDQLYQLEEYDMVIDEKEVRALNTIARKNQVTVNTVFQTLWGILLQKYTNNNDVVFGVVVSGRPPEIKGIEKMVGLFLNTVPIRIKSRAEDNVVQLLTKVQEETARSKNYEYLLLADIQSRTALKGSLIDHIMAFENLPVQEEVKDAGMGGGQGLDGQFGIQDIKQYNQTNYDFNVIIIPQALFVVRFNYNSRVYEKEFIQRVGLHLKEIVKQVLDNPDTTVKEIEIITEEERQQVLFDFNQTAADYPKSKTIHELFAEQAKRTPDHIAIVGAQHAVTYSELNQKSNQLAHLLREKGVLADNIIGIMMERSVEMIIGILGILKAGAAYLPIDPEYPEERINYMLNDSGAEILLTSSNLSNCQLSMNFQPATSLAYIIYTSGTTGKPKGVMIEHGNLVRLMVNDRFRFEFNDRDVWTLFHSFCFDFSVWEMYGALLYGGKLIIIPKMAARDTGRYLEILKEHQVTVLNQTPSAFYALVNLESKNSNKDLNLRYVIFGGEALSPGKLKEWKAKYPGTKLINMYGITETTVHVTFKEIGDRDIESDVSNIGQPIPTLSTYVLDKHLNLQPIGIAGELCVSGEGVGRGYLNRPELTAEKFIDFINHEATKDTKEHEENNEKFLRGPGAVFSKSAPGRRRQKIYKSGDLARWRPDGELEYLGRIDHQVKIRGFRIELGEIENRLPGYEGIEEAVVISKEDEKGDKYLCAYFVTENDNEIFITELKEYLSGYLPEYMVPSYFIQLEKIPLTLNGKLDRKALPEPGFKIGEDYTAPRNEVEKKLVEIWSEVLGIEKEMIGIDHSFFELGGHSLKATILISRIHKVLDVKIPLAEFFIKPSIRELSRYIEAGEKETYVSIEAAEDKEYYPLSSAQKRLYLLKTMTPESTAYNSYAVFTLEGGLEKYMIEETFRKLIHRHESLRTSFHMVNGEPVQRVHNEVDFGIEYYDLAAKEREEESLIQDFIRPFDLSQPPLLRAGLIKTSGDEHIFIVDMHHIVTDGTSMGLLIDDFMTLFRGEELPGLRIQYKDYSQWQRSLMRSEIMKHQQSHWLNQFADEIPVLNLPTDYPRPGISSFEGNALGFSLAKNEAQQLKTLALEEGASLYMVLLAVFNVFLAKVSGLECIVVGTPTAGRSHTDLEKIIGMFVNTLPLSNEPKGKKTFLEFLNELKQRTLEAFENQDYQFEDLVDNVVKERDTSRNPLFDVMFALQNMEVSDIEIPGLTLKPYPTEQRASLFDLMFQGVETGEGIHFTIEYCTALFKKETVQRLTIYFNQVIASILEDRKQPISEIEIITAEERRQVLFDFNDTKTDYPRDKTIHGLFAEQVERVPDRIAVTGPAYGVGTQAEDGFTGAADLSLTYRELNERADWLCHLLRQKGVGPDTSPIVGIMIGRFVEIIIGMIGILKAGGAYLPIDPEYPEDRIKYMLAEGNVKVLVIEVSKVSGGIAVVKPSELSEGLPTHLCYVLYTSGSTGRPKGVVVEHRNVVRLVKNTNYIAFQENDHILQTGAIEFDASTLEIWGPLLNGLGLYIIRKEDMLSHGTFKEVIRKYDITVICISTALFNQLASIDTGIFAGLRYLLVGGDVMPPVHANEVKCRLPRLKFIDGYGPTENTTFSTTFLIDQECPGNIPIPIGKPIANSTVYIVDKYCYLAPIGVAGELVVGGDGVARGYLNNPELTSEKFLRGPGAVFSKSAPGRRRLYKTGDLARWLADGNIQFLGRIDHQVKVRGFRIEPGEIESQLLKHEKIKEAVVVPRRGEDGNKYLCAYWISALPAGEPGSNLTVSELKAFLSGKLAPYMIPSYFIKLENMPMTATGKLDRKLLPALDISNITLDSTYVAPKDDMETLIADTWKEVLNLDRVGVRDNFFDLGGNSLKIIQVNDKLSNALGVKIPVVHLFKYPTVTELKKYLLQLKNGAGVQLPGVVEETQVSRPGKETPVNTDIAIIGMAGRFPGAKNIRQFWENLSNGIESISFFSTGELVESGVSSGLLDNPDYVKARAIVEEKDQFDAAFFNYTPQEAKVMDPQMRMFHECVWEALEDAGYNPETYDKPIGLYAGASKNIVWELQVNLFEQDNVMDIFESHQLTDSHFIPTRISYRLNLKGPAMFMQTACSTSLAAIHTACNALLLGDCMMSLAGGVNLSADKKSGYLYQEGLVLSPDGHCRAFDSGANGTVGGEGAAVVLLKPLEQALEGRDHIYAVIKASAANNDGARKVGFSAPSIDGQAEAIASVFRKAGIPPESITYIETHGTGTVLGDPIELEALKQAFNTRKRGFCAVGSVKTNVGHTDAAAGAISLIKTVMALKHKQIPPSLHFEVPNLQVDLVNSPFYINTELTEWNPGPYPLRAGVSSFGIGGTNAHVVLEEWKEGVESGEQGAGRPRLILLSAKTHTARDNMRKNLANYLKENLFNPANPVNPGLTFADTAYTLQVGRKSFNHRWMTVCSTAAEAIEALTTPGGGETHECLPAEKRDVPLKVEPTGDEEGLIRIGRLWLHGQEIDWQDFYPGEKRRRVSLPTYPFERQRYWIEGTLSQQQGLSQVSRMSQPPQPIRKEDIADWFYFPRWISSTLVPSQESMQESLCFLMFINECPLVKQLVGQVRSAGIRQDHSVITVEKGDTFKRKGDDAFVIDPHSSDDYHRLFTVLNQKGRFPNRVVHSWNVTDNDNDNHPGSGTIGSGFYSLLYLSKAIGKQDFDGEIRIDVVTTNIQEVTGNETLIPEKAVVLGPLKVIPQEYPYIICRCLDIELPAEGSPQEEILAGCLVNEFLLDLDSTDTDIAYRSHYRWIKAYEPVRLEAPARGPGQLKLRDRGVYLVTGGTGNIGFTLAEYLVKRFRARLILTGATALPAREEWERWLTEHPLDTLDRISRKIAKIRQLEAAGGEVLVLAADAGDKEAMKEVIREAEKTFGPINGVIHAAGVTNAKSTLCPVDEVGEEELNQQFRPKIKGTLILAELFKNKELDFCLLTASLSPILGGLGFFAYSAANAFMDTFAHFANRSGPVRWISVDWADWGFAREVDSYSPSSLGASAVDMMISPDEGVETFKRILTLVHSPVSQVVVSAGNLQTRIDQWVKLRSLRRNDSPGVPGESLYQYQSRARPDLSTQYTPPRTPIEQTIANIWKHQFGFEKIGIRDDFFELGGDSLKAISMVSKIHKELSARVQLNEFFTRPTVETLAQFITGSEESSYVSIPSVEKREYYALSSAQKRLFVLDRMETLGTSYNLSMVTLLAGELDRERLEQIFKLLVERHESFRTSFEMLEGEPVQRMHEEVEFEIEYYDLAAKNAKEREEENLIKNFIRPFDLSRAPLLRVGLIHTPAFGHPSQEGIPGDKYILMVDMHHIIFDGVSQQVLLGEFAALYGNKNKTLPLLRLQYKDYSQWQNSPQQREFIEKQEAYWLKELGGDIPVLALPIDYPRPLVQSFAGGAVHSGLTVEETKGLNEIARVQGATLFMVLLAAYDIFLSKISAQEDIQVGTPIAGRPHTDLEQIVGMFVNTLVMRNYPSPQKTFRQFLSEVKEKTLKAFENQDSQFEDLVEKLEVPRDTSRNPLYDVVFVLQNIAQPAPEMPVPGYKNNRDSGMNLNVAPLPLEKTTSQFDLVLEASEQAEQLYFLFQYCSKLFRKETIERFIGYFKKVAAAVIENPGIEIAGIEIISGEEKKQVLEDFNAAVGQYPDDKTLHELFAEQVSITPDGIAVVGKEEKIEETVQLTYRELNRKSNQLAHCLVEKGIKPGELVGILADRSPGMIIGILGILKAGGGYVPLDPSAPAPRTTYMAEECNVKLVLTLTHLIDEDNNPFKDYLYIDEYHRYSNIPEADPERKPVPGDWAYVIFTSGSTGKPKGVPITHANLSPLLHWGYDHLGLGPKDRTIQNVSYYFDWSVWEIFITLTTGAGLVVVPGEPHLNPEMCIDFINKQGITVLHATPSHYRYFVDVGRRLETLTYLFLGAEKLTQDLVQQSFKSVNPDCRVFNMYGPTEATIITNTLEILQEDDNKFQYLSSVPIGGPVANLNLLVLDSSLNLCPVNVTGEMYIGGDGVANGYLNRPELTAEKFMLAHSSWLIADRRKKKASSPGDPPMSYELSAMSCLYKTGDLVRWLADGNIEFLGRVDFQVKIRGFRIELGEIETQLASHPGIKETVVLAFGEQQQDKFLCAYVILNKENEELFSEDPEISRELNAFLSQILPDYMVPSHFIPIEKIPLTPNGKLDRRALPMPEAQGRESGKYVPPANEMEKQLAGIWAEVLGRDPLHAPVGMNDDFFELGGHSLKATILVSKVQKAFNVHLPLTEVFRTPTVRELARCINNTVKEQFISIEPVEKREYYSLSSAQKRLYILHRMEVENTAYNMPQVIPLAAAAVIDKEKLEQVFRQLIARHESLRTSFIMVDQEPVQRVHDEVEFVIEQHTPPFVRPFDLSQAPLLRIGLLERGEGGHLLMVDMHHIISDGLSMEILTRDFNSLYSGHLLPDLYIQYKDFAQWQNSRKIRESVMKQKSYWLQVLAGEIPVLNLPQDYPRPAVQSFDGGTLGFDIGNEETSDLKRLAQEKGITLYMVLLAFAALLMSKLSGQEDIIMGTPIAGRRHADLEKIIGMFVNTLVIRNQPSGEKSFEEFLKEVKTNTLQAFENQDYQFEDLVEKANVKRDAGRNPLFDVMFSMQTIDVPGAIGPKTGSADQTLYEPENPVSKFDLTLGVIDTGVTLFCSIQYAARLFKPETIQRFSRDFKRIVSALLAQPAKKLNQVDILGDEEKKRILYTFNATDVDYPEDKNIHKLFEEQAKRTPGHIAIIGGTHELHEERKLQVHITYHQLNDKSDQLAYLLREKGVGPDTVVGIMIERSLEMIIGLIGILKAGGAYLPISPDYPKERVDYMLKDSGAKVLLREVSELSKVSGGTEVIDLSSLIVEDEDAEPTHLTHLTQPTHLCYIIYTSGTTGTPKGVLVQHRNVVNLVCWFGKQYRLQSGVNILQLSDYTFDASVNQVFSPLLHGAAVYLVHKDIVLDIDALRQYIMENQINIINFVPGLLKQLFRGWEKPRCLQVVLSGGQVLEEELKNDILRQGYRLYNQYGPTEATVDALTQACRLDAEVTLGRPISNMKAYILDQNRHLLPVGVVGELWVSGAGVARGYLNRPELTAEKFMLAHSSWLIADRREKKTSGSGDLPMSYELSAMSYLYKTGDLAKWRSDGEIQFVGRKDLQVKIRGFRIELEEIENHLLKHQKVRETVVIAREDAEREKYLCAYVVSEGKPLPAESLRNFLSETLPSYMIPMHIVMMEAFPLTPGGKVNRRSLPEPGAGSLEGEYAAPRDKIEEKLIEIWSEVLGINTPIGIDDNFFELGGHSLKATVMISTIHREFDVNVPLAEMFQNPVARKLSEYIRNASTSSFSAIEKTEEKEYYPLSAAQKRLYIIQQMELQSTRYNMLHIFPFVKEIDERRLEETFRKLINRHESLRTGFHMIDDEPVQKVHDEVEFEIEQHTPPFGHPSQEGIIKDFIRPFDLSKAPLMRVGLIKTRQTDYLLVIEMHHIISDGTSQKILEQEFSALYAGKELPLPKLQYKDYSQWQNSSQQQEIMEIQEKYWLREFSGQLPILNLPADHPRPPVQRYEGRQLCFFINKEVTHGLKELCRKTGVSLFMVLLSALNVLLSRLSGQEDIIVGTPMAGRRHADLQDIIGMFVNTLSMRNYPEREKKFSDFLKDVKERTLEVYENQEYPFEELVDNVSVKRDTSRNPIFDVLFNFLNQSDFQGEIKEAGIDDISDMGESKANFDIIFQGSEVEGVLYFSVDYCTKLYHLETIKRFINYFKRILNEIKEDPTQRLSSLDIISVEEKRQILVDFNDTAADYSRDKTIHELFDQQVDRTPDRLAVIGHGCMDAWMHREVHITYRELNKRSNQVAHLLKEKGVLADNIIGIMMERSVEMIIGLLGILKSGGAYLPIDPEYPEERIQYMLHDSNTRVLLKNNADEIKSEIRISKSETNPNYQNSNDRNEITPGIVLNFEHLNFEFVSDFDIRASNLNPSNLCYIIYTSGSTGKPKGVLVEHGGVFNTIYWRKQEYGLTVDDGVLQLFSFSFDGFVTSFFTPIVSGSRVVLPTDEEARDVFRIKELIVSHKITHFICVPSLYASLLELCSNSPGVLSGLRIVTLAGENVQAAVVEKSKQLLPHLEVVNEYGATENTVAATVARDVKPGTVISIGKPLSNTQVLILDMDDHLVPIGIPGQLCIAGIGIARGYLNRPELTAEKFVLAHSSWLIADRREKKAGSSGVLPMSYELSAMSYLYKSGDLARWLADGNIEFIGRVDLQVKIRGFRIELGEIENHILHHEYVKETVVIDREADSGDKYLCAYIVTDPGLTGALEGEFREYLSRFLPGYMIPSAFVQMEKIPRTPNGKIHRKALPKPEIRGTGEYEAPRNQAEEQLICIYRELMGVEKVGIRDDFFALGGNSLKAIKLVSRIHETFNIDISVVQIFKTPAIRDLTPVLMENRFVESKDETVTLLNSAKPGKIFAFPPAVGYSIAYTELARLLEDYGFYAFNYIEKQGENQMKIYLDAIREIQPEGPYILLGYSSGGKLCVKAAELLEKAGHMVSDIIILDTYTRVPRQTEQEKEEETAEFYQGIEKGIKYLGLQHMKQKIMDTVKKYIRYHDSLELRGKVNATIHLIQAEDKKGKEGLVGWGDFTRNREIVYEGYGVHQEMLAPGFIEKNVEVIDKILVDSAYKSG